MSDRGPSSGAPFGILAAGVGLCCGLPVLLGTGLVIGATGVAVGSGLLVAAALAVAAWAWFRRRQRAACEARETETTDDTGRKPFSP